MVKNPTIKIAGKTREPKPPTMRMWRRVAEFDDRDKTEIAVSKLLDEYLAIIADVFGVDPADIEDSVMVCDLIPLYRECAAWVFSCAFEKLGKIPNADAAKARS